MHRLRCVVVEPVRHLLSASGGELVEAGTVRGRDGHVECRLGERVSQLEARKPPAVRDGDSQRRGDRVRSAHWRGAATTGLTRPS